eukprot:465349_1
MLSFALLVASLSFSNIAFASNSASYVWTPHGSRLSQCVHTATESEAVIESILNTTHDGVLVSYPLSGTSAFYPTLPECVKEANQLSIGASNHDWQQNLYEDNTGPFGSFSGDYSLPNETPKSDGQVLSFFIGLVNYGQSNEQVTIIQPCIRYEGGSSSWSMASWNCCPNGQSHEGKIVPLPTNAKNIHGFCSANSSVIYVSAEYNGQKSTITQPNDGRKFNYVDVTLEQHFVTTDCDDYNKKPFNFTNLRIKKENGQTFTPNWKIKSNDSCHGGIQEYGKYNAAIWGADKPK